MALDRTPKQHSPAGIWAPIALWVVTACWLGLIWWLSDQTGSSLRSWFPFAKDLSPGHLALFGVLAALIWISLRRSGVGSGLAAFVSLGTTTIYGYMDELHQRSTPGRSYALSDMLLDFLGAAITLALIYWLDRRLKRLTGADQQKPKELHWEQYK